MTRISRISFIAFTFATAGFAMLSQNASAATANSGCAALSATQMSKCCARLANQDTTACRDEFVRIKQKRQLVARLIKDDDGRGGGKGGSGRGNGRK